MKCVNCGNELKEGAKFCTGCGTPIVEQKIEYDYSYPYQEPELVKTKKNPTIFIVIGLIVIGIIIAIVAISCNNNTELSNAYSVVVNNYIKAANGGSDKLQYVDNTIIENYRSGKINSLYYATYDVDGNGTEELLISTYSQDSNKYVVLAVYQYNGGIVSSITVNTNNVPSNTTWSLMLGGSGGSSNVETTVAEPLNKQVIKVKSSGSTATFTLEQWSEGTWKTLMKTTANIGSNGVTTNKKEGDKCTPAGKFDILFAFSTYDLSNKTKLRTKSVYTNDVWVTDSSSKYYNTFQDEHSRNWNSQDDIYANFSQGKSYACIAFNFNGDCETIGSATSGKGSAIWIDGVGSNGNATSGYGDIKISADDMATLLQYLDRSMNPQVVIE